MHGTEVSEGKIELITILRRSAEDPKGCTSGGQQPGEWS